MRENEYIFRHIWPSCKAWGHLKVFETTNKKYTKRLFN